MGIEGGYNFDLRSSQSGQIGLEPGIAVLTNANKR